jgi:hypothetical protein
MQTSTMALCRAASLLPALLGGTMPQCSRRPSHMSARHAMKRQVRIRWLSETMLVDRGALLCCRPRY